MARTIDEAKGENLRETVERVITDHPLASVTIGFGAGLALGLSPLAGLVPWAIYRVARTALGGDAALVGEAVDAVRNKVWKGPVS